MKKTKLIIGLVAILGAGTAHADINQLKSLLGTGDAQKAYDYALSVSEEFEGDPSFDYYYGLAAVESGNYNEAIFAFDRVLLSKPKHRAAKVELARAHFLIENYDQSETLFNESLEANPPAEAEANIRKYLAAIKAKRSGAKVAGRSSVRGVFKFGVGIDDNINGSPGTEQGEINGLTILLDPNNLTPENTTEIESVFNNIELGLSGRRLIGQRHALNWGTSLRGSYNHQVSDYNTTNFTYQLGMQHAINREHSIAYSGLLTTEMRDGLHYRNRYGGVVAWNWRLSQQEQLSVNYVRTQTDHKEVRVVDNSGVATIEDPSTATRRDTNFDNIAATYVRTNPDLNNFKFLFGVSYGQERVVNEVLVGSICSNCRLYDRNAISWRTNISADINKDHRFGVGYQFLRSSYRDLPLTTSVAGDEKREDTLNLIRFNHNWKFAENWVMNNALERYDNRANFSVNAYDRTRLATEVQYNF